MFALCIRFTSAVKYYSRLKNRLGERDSINSFDEHQGYSRRVQRILGGVLMPVDPVTGKPRLTDMLAPEVPTEWWPKGSEFIQLRAWFGLQNAARWAAKGLKYHELDSAIIPRPGCYFAVPTSKWVCAHFAGVERWLLADGMAGVERAVDVGTGCGVIGMMLLKHGQPDAIVTSVDINPAAVGTVEDTAKSLGLEDRWHARISDLVPTDLAQPQDLIVFNPPWFPTVPNPAEGAGREPADSDAPPRSRTDEIIDGGHWLEAAS
jgi:hypothetical protein